MTAEAASTATSREASGAIVTTSVVIRSPTGVLARSASCSVRASATSRSVRTPAGRPPSVTGTTPQPASRKMRTASRAELAGEQVRGSVVIASETFTRGLTRSDGETSGTGSGVRQHIKRVPGVGLGLRFRGLDLRGRVRGAGPPRPATAGVPAAWLDRSREPLSAMSRPSPASESCGASSTAVTIPLEHAVGVNRQQVAAHLGETIDGVHDQSTFIGTVSSTMQTSGPRP